MAALDKEVEQSFPYLTLYKDGSVYRDPLTSFPPSPEPATDGVASKDITLNAELGLWVRIFLPSPPPKQNLPLVLYFHGGGFLICTPAWAGAHSFCAQMTKRSGSICISASYRLAPEHRLPAAIDDGFAAFQWLHSQARLQADGKKEAMDPWLADADFSKFFIAGESAGGVLAHHVAARAMDSHLPSSSWAPICIKGLILLHPAFVRETRTPDELETPEDEMMDWEKVDFMLRLTVPVGSGKESPYFNPLPAISSSQSAFRLPKTLAVLADGDLFHVLALKYVRAIKDAGCLADVFMSYGVGHGFYVFAPETEKALAMKESINTFIAQEAMAS